VKTKAFSQKKDLDGPECVVDNLTHMLLKTLSVSVHITSENKNVTTKKVALVRGIRKIVPCTNVQLIIYLYICAVAKYTLYDV